MLTENISWNIYISFCDIDNVFVHVNDLRWSMSKMMWRIHSIWSGIVRFDENFNEFVSISLGGWLEKKSLLSVMRL